jgi:hypothetical protein
MRLLSRCQPYGPGVARPDSILGSVPLVVNGCGVPYVRQELSVECAGNEEEPIALETRPLRLRQGVSERVSVEHDHAF